LVLSHLLGGKAQSFFPGGLYDSLKVAIGMLPHPDRSKIAKITNYYLHDFFAGLESSYD